MQPDLFRITETQLRNESGTFWEKFKVTTILKAAWDRLQTNYSNLCSKETVRFTDNNNSWAVIYMLEKKE